MIEKMSSTSPGVIAVQVTGWVLRDDFDAVRPLVDDALQRGAGIRALIRIDDTFAGMTPGAMLADLTLGLRAFRHWVGCAIVAPSWLRTSARVAGLLVPWPVRVFDLDELDDAFDWLRELEEGSGGSGRAAVTPGAEVGPPVTGLGDRPLVVVGADGSPDAAEAARWVLGLLAPNQPRLRLVHIRTGSEDPSHTPAWLDRLVRELSSDVQVVQPPPGRMAAAEVGVALADLSRDAGLLVVGGYGEGSGGGLRVGSTALELLGWAPCPVAVRGAEQGQPPSTNGPVAVGYDGSRTADAALELAAGLAETTKAPLLVTHSWSEMATDPIEGSYQVRGLLGGAGGGGRRPGGPGSAACPHAVPGRRGPPSSRTPRFDFFGSVGPGPRGRSRRRHRFTVPHQGGQSAFRRHPAHHDCGLAGPTHRVADIGQTEVHVRSVPAVEDDLPAACVSPLFSGAEVQEPGPDRLLIL